MAGYIKNPQAHRLDGLMVANAATKRGKLQVVSSNKLANPAADTTSKFTCIGIEDMQGKKGYVFRLDVAAAEYYFVDNDDYVFFNVGGENSADVNVAAGEFVKGYHLIAGDIIITDQVTGTPVVGTQYGVKADGTIG